MQNFVSSNIYDFQKSELSKNILLKVGKIVYFFIEIRNEYLNNNNKKKDKY